MRRCICVLFCFHVVLYWTVAKGETTDVHAFLPLLECNSIAQKVLDINYSISYEWDYDGEKESGRKDVHLIFDGATENFREKTQTYDDINDKEKCRISVRNWNGKEYSFWEGFSSKISARHDSGVAIIQGEPDIKIPTFVDIFYDKTELVPLEKTISELEPKLEISTDNTIIVDSIRNRFEFSKKNGILRRLIFYRYEWGGGTRYAQKTYELSDHVEVSGIWIPRKIFLHADESNHKEKVGYKAEIVVDPKTLRLQDKADISVFTESLPAGCFVNDQVRRKTYQVTTLDVNPPQDVEALQKMLDKMLDQAEEQKTAIEKIEQEQK